MKTYIQGLTTGFLFWSDVVQSKQYYNSGAMGSFITIMSEGNGVDFGDLNGGMSTGMGQVSSGHGGL